MIKIFKRRRVYARFKDNICTADLSEMGSLSSKNRSVKYLLCKTGKDKKGEDKKAKTVLGFIEIVYEFKRKPNKLRVD